MRIQTIIIPVVFIAMFNIKVISLLGFIHLFNILVSNYIHGLDRFSITSYPGLWIVKFNIRLMDYNDQMVIY